MVKQLQFPPAVTIAAVAVITIKKDGKLYRAIPQSGSIGLNPDGSSYQFLVKIIDEKGIQVQTFYSEFSLGGSSTGSFDLQTGFPLYNIVFHGLGLGSAQASLVPCPGDVFEAIQNLTLINTNVVIEGFGKIEEIRATNLGIGLC